MLDIFLAVFTLILAVTLRSARLSKIRSLTVPLVLTSLASAARFLATTLPIDPQWERWTTVVLVLAAGFLLARATLLLVFEWVLGRRMGVSVPQLVQDVIALIFYATLAAILLRNLGVEITGLIATSAVITVVIGLALQQTLGNLLAGMVLAWEQRLQTGAWIDLEDRIGRIEETGWRSLIVRTRLGKRILIPNSDVASTRISLLGKGESPVAVPVRLGVAYAVPPDAAKAVFGRLAADIPLVLQDPPPQILTTEFADSAVLYECRLGTNQPWLRDDIIDQFLTRAHAALARAGMEIPFPQRTLHRPQRREAVDSLERRLAALSGGLLFTDLSEEALQILGAHSRLLRFAPGEAVVRQGDASSALFLVATGTASVQQRGREISRIASGEVFGEMAFLTGSPRNATVRAVSGPLEVIEIDAGSLRNLLDNHPDVAEKLAQRMAERRIVGETARDESGAIFRSEGLVSQLRHHLLRFVGGPRE